MADKRWCGEKSERSAILQQGDRRRHDSRDIRSMGDLDTWVAQFMETIEQLARDAHGHVVQRQGVEVKKLERHREDLSNMAATQGSVVTYIEEVVRGGSAHDIVLAADDLPDTRVSYVPVLPPNTVATRHNKYRFLEAVERLVRETMDRLEKAHTGQTGTRDVESTESLSINGQRGQPPKSEKTADQTARDPQSGCKTDITGKYDTCDRCYIIIALIISRLDYGNSLLARLPKCLLQRLQ